LFKACEKDGDIDELLYDMKEQGVGADVVTYNTMIKTLCLNKMWTQATRVVTEMESRGVSPNSITYSYLMNAMRRAGKPYACLALFESACGNPQTNSFTDNVNVYNIAISAASMIQDHERALELVSRMNANGIKPNLQTLTAVMGACIASDRPDLAVQLFRRIENPDGYAMAQGISSLWKSGALASAADYIEEHGGRDSAMTGSEIMRSYTDIFRAAVRADDLDIARRVLTDLLKKGYIPKKQMFSSISDVVRAKRSPRPTKQVTLREDMFDLCLFIIDSLRNRNLPIDGSFYATTLMVGNRLGGLSRKIASLLAASKTVEETNQQLLATTESEPTNSYHPWEELKNNYNSYKSSLEDKLAPLPVRIPANNMRAVMKAEYLVAFVPNKKNRPPRKDPTASASSS
jgi:pentatricopeptide repeat protein